MPVSPPKFWTRLFKWFCHAEYLEELLGDLEEGFYEDCENRGTGYAKRRYRLEIIKMVRPSVIRSLQIIPTHAMLLSKNYIKTSLRAVKLNPFYVFANVLGLALALSVCTIAYFNYQFNGTFNTYFKEADNVYKIHGERMGESTLGVTSMRLAPNLKSAEVEAFRYLSKSLTLGEKDRMLRSQIAFTDPEFLSYFEFRSINEEAIKAPKGNQIILSEELASRLFDDLYPIGELVKVSFPNLKEATFQVKDVYQKPPTNISFNQSAFVSLEAFIDYFEIDKQDWKTMVDATFIVASTEEELNRANAELGSLLNVRNTNITDLEISSFRLDDIFSWPAFEHLLYGRQFGIHLHPSSVMGIAGSALAVLLLACFNFINTSIALSGKRLKEIAVRKILGGNRKTTMTQFLMENTFMIALAVLFSFVISIFLIPEYNALFQRELIQLDTVPISDILIYSFVIISVVGLLAAAYPSFYVSRFSALKIFSKSLTLTNKNQLMAFLLTFQFALCFYNLFGWYLLIDNSYYQETLDRGYEVDQSIVIPLNRPEQYQVLEDHLFQNPLVERVSGVQNIIGYSSETEILTDESIDHTVSVVRAGKGYPETMGLRLREGNFFEGSNENANEVVINAMLQDRLGKDLLHTTISLDGNRYKVVGIVDNFNLRSIVLEEGKITPTVIKLIPPDSYRNAAVKVTGSADEANRVLETLWYEVFPQELYTGFPQSRVMKPIRELNVVMIKINSFVGIITILISILGLYTLISLKVQRRSKEFGIRKVLGASQSTIANLLGQDLYWMVGIAAVAGLAGSTYVFGLVFDIIYAYHLEPEIIHFVQATVTVILILVATVAYQVMKTSRMNPTEQLRLE